MEDFHFPAAEHARHTGFALSRSRFAPVCAALVAPRHFFLAQPPLLCEEGNGLHPYVATTAGIAQPVLFFAGTGTPGIFTLTEKRVLLVVK